MDMELLARYLDKQEKSRDERFHKIYANMSERERLIFREAAVMGFVQGIEAANYKPNPFPKDSVIAKTVALHASDFPDLYPMIAHLAHHQEEEK